MAIAPKRAFTLIELLVVVAIISVLAALLMPALRTALESADTVNCLSNQKQMFLGIMAYVEDFDGALPSAGRDYPYGGQHDASQRLQDGDYFDLEPESIWCPAWRRNHDVWKPTISYVQEWREYDYAMMGARPWASSSAKYRWIFENFPKISTASRHMLTSDSAGLTVNIVSGNNWSGSSPFRPTDGIGRHFEKSNRVFCDGHGKLMHWIEAKDQGYHQGQW